MMVLRGSCVLITQGATFPFLFWFGFFFNHHIHHVSRSITSGFVSNLVLVRLGKDPFILQLM